MAFKGVVSGRLGMARGEIDITEDGSFSRLKLSGPANVVHIGEMHFIAQAPHPLGRLLDQN